MTGIYLIDVTFHPTIRGRIREVSIIMEWHEERLPFEEIMKIEDTIREFFDQDLNVKQRTLMTGYKSG